MLLAAVLAGVSTAQAETQTITDSDFGAGFSADSLTGDSIIFNMSSSSTTSEQHYWNGNVSTGKAIQIGVVDEEGTWTGGYYVTNGSGQNITFSGVITGGGTISKTGPGTGYEQRFTGDMSGFSGDIVMGGTVATTFYIGYDTAAATYENISGTGNIRFATSNNTLVYAHTATTNTEGNAVVLTIGNTIGKDTNGTSKVNINGHASYLFTKEVVIDTLSVAQGRETASVGFTSGTVSALTGAGGSNIIKSGEGTLNLPDIANNQLHLRGGVVSGLTLSDGGTIVQDGEVATTLDNLTLNGGTLDMSGGALTLGGVLGFGANRTVIDLSNWNGEYGNGTALTSGTFSLADNSIAADTMLNNRFIVSGAGDATYAVKWDGSNLVLVDYTPTVLTVSNGQVVTISQTTLYDIVELYGGGKITIDQGNIDHSLNVSEYIELKGGTSTIGGFTSGDNAKLNAKITGSADVLKITGEYNGATFKGWTGNDYVAETQLIREKRYGSNGTKTFIYQLQEGELSASGEKVLKPWGAATNEVKMINKTGAALEVKFDGLVNGSNYSIENKLIADEGNSTSGVILSLNNGNVHIKGGLAVDSNLELNARSGVFFLESTITGSGRLTFKNAVRISHVDAESDNVLKGFTGDIVIAEGTTTWGAANFNLSGNTVEGGNTYFTLGAKSITVSSGATLSMGIKNGMFSSSIVLNDNATLYINDGSKDNSVDYHSEFNGELTLNGSGKLNNQWDKLIKIGGLIKDGETAGKLIVFSSNANARVDITNDNNTYSNGTQIGSDAVVNAVGTNSLGTGEIELTGLATLTQTEKSTIRGVQFNNASNNKGISGINPEKGCLAAISITTDASTVFRDLVLKDSTIGAGDGHTVTYTRVAAIADTATPLSISAEDAIASQLTATPVQVGGIASGDLSIDISMGLAKQLTPGSTFVWTVLQQVDALDNFTLTFGNILGALVDLGDTQATVMLNGNAITNAANLGAVALADGNLVLSIQVSENANVPLIPEPATATLSLLALAALAARRRRKG